MTLESINAVFVYGTLKTGQCRESCWPRKPLEVRRAWTLGALYDTGPYPALFAGEDMVAGQVWIFDADDMQQLLPTWTSSKSIARVTKPQTCTIDA